jgi:RimJ/RimL family protein N-acetyltransferase
MSADATIRRLRSDDAASFKAIRLDALKANPESFGSTFELEHKLDVTWFAGRLEDAHVMGAFRDGELVGTVGFSIQQGQKNSHKGRLWGNVVRENRPARRLYESVGFLEFGIEPKALKYGDRYYDEAHMALDFSRAATKSGASDS